MSYTPEICHYLQNQLDFLLYFINRRMDYYRQYCPQHPCDPITNFCCEPNCLVGLCATCVCEHTQQHVCCFTAPKFENIKDTYNKYNERMREQIELIEQDKEWLSDILNNIEQKKNNVKDTIKKARNDCLNLVNQHFDNLQAKMSAEIASEGKKNSLHSTYRLQTLNTLLNRELSNLLHFSQELSSSKFLDSVKNAEDEIFPNSRDFHLKICKELKENEVYTANAVYREEFLKDLNFSLKRLINLEFLLPRVEFVQGPPPQGVRRANSMNRNNSSSAVFSSMRQSELTPSKMKNISTLLPKHTTSIIMPPSAFPFQQIMSKATQATSPLTRGSRLAPNLKIIRESKRQSCMGDEFKSMTSSNVSYNKENELAHSMFIDTGSSFYR